MSPKVTMQVLAAQCCSGAQTKLSITVAASQRQQQVYTGPLYNDTNIEVSCHESLATLYRKMPPHTNQFPANSRSALTSCILLAKTHCSDCTCSCLMPALSAYVMYTSSTQESTNDCLAVQASFTSTLQAQSRPRGKAATESY